MTAPRFTEFSSVPNTSTVIAAITLWNTIYMDKAASHLEQASPLYDAKLLPHTSPLGWEHASYYPATSIGILAPLTAKLRDR